MSWSCCLPERDCHPLKLTNPAGSDEKFPLILNRLYLANAKLENTLSQKNTAA
jgi:hypothetical protein